MDIKALIREIPDFPKPGIQFKDITTLLRDGAGLRATIDLLAERVAEFSPDFIVGMESRGFIIGTPLAYKLGIGFIPVRKPGKLPAEVYAVDYELEYGMDRLEVHKDALHPPNCRILIVDDLIATGGTAAATAKLVQDAGCSVVGFGFLIELKELNGRKNLPDVPIVSLIEYD